MEEFVSASGSDGAESRGGLMPYAVWWLRVRHLAGGVSDTLNRTVQLIPAAVTKPEINAQADRTSNKEVTVRKSDFISVLITYAARPPNEENVLREGPHLFRTFARDIWIVSELVECCWLL